MLTLTTHNTRTLNTLTQSKQAQPAAARREGHVSVPPPGPPSCNAIPFAASGPYMQRNWRLSMTVQGSLSRASSLGSGQLIKPQEDDFVNEGPVGTSGGHASSGSNNYHSYGDAPLHYESSGDDGRESGDNATDNSGKKSGPLRHISAFRRKCGAIVNHPWTQVFIVLLIVVNAIMIGIGTFDFVTENARIDGIFQKVDRAFLIIFTIELVMQFVYRGLHLFTDGWLVFDLVIIVMSWAFESVQIIRAFRIFRALRLVTRIETLRDLVSSLFAVFPRLSAIGMLLLLVFYIFAVMTTTLFQDLPLSDDYFNNLGLSLFTLFQFMTMEWSEVTREVMEYYSWAWAPFVIFVAISGFIVFNLIIAVICDAVAIIESEKHDEDEGGEKMDGAHIDEMTQQKIQDLNKQMTGLVFAQQQMQQQIDNLTREYYALQGLDVTSSVET